MDFKYEELQDKECIITAYNGNSKVLEFPDTIEGLKVTEIDEDFIDFGKKNNLEKIIISKYISEIPTDLFASCENLTKLVINSDDIYIGGSSFSGCKNLREVIINSDNSIIGASSFENCINLETVKLKEGVEEIYNNAFFNCKKLKEINLPDSLLDIGSKAFYGCSYLENIHISKNIKTLKSSVFEYCTSLKEIEITEGVKEISERVFANCVNLEEVVIKNGVEKIGNGVFWNCINLRKCVFPNTINEVGSNIFYGYEKLRFLYMDYSELKKYDSYIRDLSILTYCEDRDSYSAEEKELYDLYIKESEKERFRLLKKIVTLKRVECLIYFTDRKYIFIEYLEELINIANEKALGDLVAILLEYKNSNFDQDKLNEELEKEFERELLG